MYTIGDNDKNNGEYHDLRFDKINDYRNLFFDYHYIHVHPTNSLATLRRQRFAYEW